MRSPRLMRILNAAQMREADRFTIEEIGIPSLVLMENAGRQVVAAMEAAYETQLEGRVAVLCGPRQQRRRRLRRGANAAAARHRYRRCSSSARWRTCAATPGPNLDILGRLGVTVVEINDEQSWELHFSEISQCTLIVDAIFGTGLKDGARRDARNRRRRRQRLGHSDRRRSTCRAGCRPIRRTWSATASTRR